MHTTELDNGVRVHYDGGDIGGEVLFVLPDGRSIETTWERMFAGEEPLSTCEIRESIPWLIAQLKAANGQD